MQTRGEDLQDMSEDIQALQRPPESIQGIPGPPDVNDNMHGIFFGQRIDKKNDRNLFSKTGMNDYYYIILFWPKQIMQKNELEFVNSYFAPNKNQCKVGLSAKTIQNSFFMILGIFSKKTKIIVEIN